MTTTGTLDGRATASPVEHVDVLIVGAGISGVGAAYHLQEQCPERSFVVLEAMEDFGGTWRVSHVSRHPLRQRPVHVRLPLQAVDERADRLARRDPQVHERGDRGERPRSRTSATTTRSPSATWSSEEDRWTLAATDTDTGEVHRFTTNFLWMCQGYYRHAEGHTPEWPGMDRFRGPIVHPQTWPEDLDYRGKEVIVIGSGATTATLVPAMAAAAEHITVIQRSPTYFWTGRNVQRARRHPARARHRRDVDPRDRPPQDAPRPGGDHPAVVRAARPAPRRAAQRHQGAPARGLPASRSTSRPSYRPWQQRLAFVPDGDLFEGIKAGKASMVTDEIDTFTEHGIRLKSGREVTGDIVVTATGFNLSVLGDIQFTIDGEPLAFHDTITYRGMMFTGIPNMVLGVRLLPGQLDVARRPDRRLHVPAARTTWTSSARRRVTPQLRPEDADMPILSWIDPENFNPNYLMRSLHLLPQRGDKPEWMHTQDYWTEKDALPAADLDDGCLRYE